MAEFYHHPETGVLHLRAAAGGTGGGATSVYDAPARKEDFAAHPKAHAAYLRKKQMEAASEKAAAAREAVIHQVEETVDAVKHAVADETEPQS